MQLHTGCADCLQCRNRRFGKRFFNKASSMALARIQVFFTGANVHIKHASPALTVHSIIRGIESGLAARDDSQVHVQSSQYPDYSVVPCRRYSILKIRYQRLTDRRLSGHVNLPQPLVPARMADGFTEISIAAYDLFQHSLIYTTYRINPNIYSSSYKITIYVLKDMN